jgi:fatty acid omega-hydroxylase
MSIDSRTLQSVGAAGAATVAVLAALSLKYNDRPLFYEHPEGIPYQKGLPILGNLPKLLSNVHRLYDFQCDQFNKLDTLTM